MVRSFIEQSKLKFYKMIKALFYIEKIKIKRDQLILNYIMIRHGVNYEVNVIYGIIAYVKLQIFTFSAIRLRNCEF